MNLFKISDMYIATDACEEDVAKAILDTTKKVASLSNNNGVIFDTNGLIFDPYEYVVEQLLKRGFKVWDYFDEGIKKFKL